MPETPSIPAATVNSTVSVPALLQRSPSKLGAAFRSASEVGRRGVNGEEDGEGEGDGTRSQLEKQRVLERYLGNVDDLVADLRETTPFGGVLS